ncbi:sporulation-specific protein 15-like [Oryza brachyantha]|uniref:C2 NT-type domain-containing protein n=1 Tax=Oryza brachyantha TaxID=4533 RepID=J3LJ29_ORYBR|nr:sporulation-specific protein 15-like [Oryza brachyantha]
MFKLHRHRSSDRVGQRFDFRFFNFRAVQVPAVSDRLFLSIVSVDTGKTVAKSSKAAAHIGICQWPDNILETIWFSQDEVSKKFDECQYKIVVSVGSIKSGVLGEIFLNLTNFLNLVDPTAISLPLKKCNSGTVLQLKVQYLGTKSKLSGVRAWKDLSPRLDDRSPTNDDIDSKSDGSDSIANKSVRSSSGNPLGGTTQDEPGHRETSFSASGSHRSSNSGDSTADRTNFSPRDSSNGGVHVGRQDSASSYVSYVSASRGDEEFRSNNSSFSSRASGPNVLQGNTPKSFGNGFGQVSLGTSDSSKELLEAAEETIEELRDEAKMWERHSRKLKADLEMLKKECSEKSKQQAELEVELSAAHAERDSYRQEIDELKSSMQEVTTRQKVGGTSKYGDWIDLQKELEDDIKFLKESNANLSIQLKNTQEANIELVSILQELEETIEEQKTEISKLSKVRNVTDLDALNKDSLVKQDTEWAKQLSIKEDEITMLREKLNRVLNIENAGVAASGAVYLELEKENELLRVKIQELEKDCSELTDENLELIYKLKEVGGVTKGQGNCIPNKSNLEIEELTSKICQLEEELRNKELLHTGRFADASISSSKELQEKCANLELKLLNFRSQAYDLEEKFQKSQEELEQRNLELSELRQKLDSSHSTTLEDVQTNGTRGYQFRGESIDNEPDTDMLKAKIQLQQQENDDLRCSKVEMETVISKIQAEKSRLEERLEASLKESSISSKCLDEVRQDILVLSSSIDSHVSANKVLERKVAELESCKAELELHISNLEQENVELSERISGLEAQLTYMTNEKDSSELQIHDSKSLIVNLKDKLERQQSEMESQRLEFKQKQQEAQRKLSEAQDDSEVQRRSNTKLQSTVESLIEECSSLQNQIADLKRQKLELHGHLTQQEQELDNSKKRNFDFGKTVEFLEAKLSSLQKDISSKEQSLLSELESIFQEHTEQEERINRAHFMLNKIEKEKTLEVENLEREVMSLTAQTSSTQEERENATVEAIREVSVLRADKVKLEASLQDVSAQLRHYESQLEDLRKESKSKIKGLVDSLNASKQSEEMLTADAEHMKKLMEVAKSNEDELRKSSGELELKLKASDYEKQQMMEEISGLKLQVQKIMGLQDEVLKLKSSLDEAKFEKGKVEELLHSATEECEELKAQKAMLTDKVSNMQESLDNGEEKKRSRVAMQAKLVRLESDLSALEASHVHEAELKNEINRIKRSNSEYQRKIQSLEQENEDLTRRTQLEQMSHIKEEDLGKQEIGGSPVDEEASIHLKIQLLEAKLAEALEENKMYRAQHKSPMPDGQSAAGDGKESSNDRVLQLEGELRDMKERLLNMSLQYAEVEAQRERLVMELKAAKKGRWF